MLCATCGEQLVPRTTLYTMAGETSATASKECSCLKAQRTKAYSERTQQKKRRYYDAYGGTPFNAYDFYRAYENPFGWQRSYGETWGEYHRRRSSDCVPPGPFYDEAVVNAMHDREAKMKEAAAKDSQPHSYCRSGVFDN